MTDAELDEIEARAAACFVGPWRAETWQVECPGEECPVEMCSDSEDGPCGDDHTLETVTAPEEYPRDPAYPQVVAQMDASGDGRIRTPGLAQFARAHAVFLAAARTDVERLVAEVRRLRAGGGRVRIREGWMNAGWTGRRLGPDVMWGQLWTPVLWDGEDDPEFHKSRGIEEIA